MELTNSKRLMYSASYVTTQFTPEEQSKVESEPGGGVPKANVVRALALTAADLERLRETKTKGHTQPHDDEQEGVFSIAMKLSVAQRPMSTMELASLLAPISFDAIAQFAERATKVKELSIEGQLFLELNNRRRKISPIGRIHLERIEMYPAGVQKGELVFTVPMAPGESVAISHKEWSTSSREFEDIVQDFFESYSERGVAEKSDAAMSIESEAKHSSAVNFGASLSGSYAGVTLTTTLGIVDTNDERKSVKQSAQKTREATEKASARTRKEHKVSVKLETKTGNEDQSAKTITNTASTPIRIDYYRMMRKWRTDLYRYGLRQTYDVAIPLPGVRIWALHQRVAELDKMLRTPFPFGLKVEDLNDSNWPAKAAEFGVPSAVVPQPPQPQLHTARFETIGEFLADHFGKIDFEIPAGYWLEKAAAKATLASSSPNFTWLDGGNSNLADTVEVTGTLANFTPPNPRRSGALAASYSCKGISGAGLALLLTFSRTMATEQTWKREAWAAIRASAEARYHETLARAQEERDRLWRLLNGKDTLSLRRLEREELMRLVMYWLLGPSSELKPGGVDLGSKPASTDLVQTTAGKILSNERSFQASTTTDPFPTFTGVSELATYDAILYGEWVKFMHQAVEWENILYFLYPYFWGSEAIGRDKLLFEHADPEHERFLRAGYARIVLPVRPGFEEEFTNLVEKGTLSGHLTSPYIPIAQEIANFARTNYAGIPPANPELHARPLLFPEQRVTWDLMQKTMKDIDAYKANNGHYPTKLSELPSGSPLDAWGNELTYRMPGLGADYDLVSLGADNEVGGDGLNADISSAAGASLVATWFDYTPTSALDIEIDTKIEDLA